MSEEDKVSEHDSPDATPPRRRKRPVTIDLEAKEVAAQKSADAKDDAPHSPPAPQAAQGGAGAPGDVRASPDPVSDAAGRAHKEPAHDPAPDKAKADAGDEPRNAAKKDPVSPVHGGSSGGSDHEAQGTPMVMLLASAALGGLIVLAGAYVVQTFLPSSQERAAQGMVTRVDQIDGRVSALAEKVGQFDPAALGERLNKAEASLADLAAAVQPAKTMEDELASLRDEVRAAADAARQADAKADALSARVGTSEGALPTEDVAALREQVSALKQEVAALVARSAASSGAPEPASEAELDALRQRLGALENVAKAPAAEKSATDSGAALAVAVAGLERAVQAGRAYAAELDVVAGLAPDAPGVAELRAHAATGVASRDELARDFASIASSIVTAEQTSGGGGIWDRMLDSARSIIRIRPTGYVDGEGAAASVARAEVHLQENDLASAVSELKLLDGRARQAAQDWIERAEIRIAVEQLVGALNRDVLAKLGGRSGTTGQ